MANREVVDLQVMQFFVDDAARKAKANRHAVFLRFPGGRVMDLQTDDGALGNPQRYSIIERHRGSTGDAAGDEVAFVVVLANRHKRQIAVMNDSRI